MLRKLFATIGTLLLLVIFLTTAVTLARSPSQERDWKTEYAVLPSASIDGTLLNVRNVRDFRYSPDGSVAEARYEDRTYDLRGLEELWYGISHFSSNGLAHTFLSFGFKDGENLVVSIEARQETDESYHPVLGLLRNFELVFVLADERDVIGVRTHIKKERVHLYRIEASSREIRRMLDVMIGRVNDIHEHPEFYNTLTDNCTTSILKHVEQLSWADIYLDYRALLPGYSDEVAYELGALPNHVPLSALRQRSLLDPGRTPIDAPDFSAKIRGG